MIEISVLVITYNHEKYIGQCLESIVQQKIDAPYEVLVLDDCSTDNTVSVIKEYQRRYPQIKLLARKKNSMHPTLNAYKLYEKAKGKYLAWCEGDDFWTDSQKLKKQYEFMEKHPQYSACFAGAVVVDENGEACDDCEFLPVRNENGIYTIEDFEKLKNPGITAAFFVRNYFQQLDCTVIYQFDRYMADVTSFMLAITQGDFYQFEEEMSAYRFVRKEGGNSFNSLQQGNRYKEYNLLRYWCALQEYLQKNYDEGFCFESIPYKFYELSSKMPMKAMLQITKEYLHSAEYVKLLVLQKTSSAGKSVLSKYEKPLLTGRHADWKAFLRERKKVVIWGAGSLAAEYLDEYGWKNNVMFLTDNNRALHDKSYKGYFIRNPDELLKYKDEIVILIANDKYENEIAKQIEDMGLREYFGYYSMMRKQKETIYAKKLINKIVKGNEK